MALNFKNEDRIEGQHFLVVRVERKTARNGKDYADLELASRDGKIMAKIWGDFLANCQFEAGKVVEVSGRAEEYRGVVSLMVNRCQIVTSEEAADYQPMVATLIFDIETAGKKFEELDEKEQKYLLENLENEEENKEIAKEKTALYAIFGKVVAIGCFDPETKKGLVLALTAENLIPEDSDFNYKVLATEKELLEEFWRVAGKYERFVTYNGDSFDFPYLIIRSGINRVKVSLGRKKFDDNFIDLQNKIRQRHGFKLEFLCRAFGIENPKGQGVEGSEVSGLFLAGEVNKIADYVARDAKATAELYAIWKDYMSGENYGK